MLGHITCPCTSAFAGYLKLECKMQIIKYREFYIVTRKNKAVDLVNPHTERARAVKSVFAAKWRIGRAQNLANKVRGLV
jgi:hypothetical protein